MALPERSYYSLEQASQKVGCEIDDLFHFASRGILQFCVFISMTADECWPTCYTDSDVSDELLDKLSSNKENYKTLDYVTDLCSISEDATYFLLSKENENENECDSKILNCHGWFAINHTELLSPDFEKKRSANIVYLHPPRECRDGKRKIEIACTDGYEPSSIIFYQSQLFGVDDFYILADELNILLNGGENIFSFGLNKKAPTMEKVGQKTSNSQAKLIKSLLYLLYKDFDLIENPRSYIDNPKSEICTDFENLGLALPSGKTIEKWLKDIDIDIHRE